MYNINIEFEYDSEKSRSNMKKHGISFEDAKQIWAADHADMDTRTSLEVRRMVVGLVFGKAYTCVYTYRNSKVRIISARRSRILEERAYHERIEKKEKNNS